MGRPAKGSKYYLDLLKRRANRLYFYIKYLTGINARELANMLGIKYNTLMVKAAGKRYWSPEEYMKMYYILQAWVTNYMAQYKSLIAEFKNPAAVPNTKSLDLEQLAKVVTGGKPTHKKEDKNDKAQDE